MSDLERQMMKDHLRRSKMLAEHPRLTAEIAALKQQLAEAEIEHSKQIADMATRFRAVNIQRVIEQTGQDIFAMADNLEAAESKLAEARDDITRGVEEELRLNSRLGVETCSRETAEAKLAEVERERDKWRQIASHPPVERATRRAEAAEAKLAEMTAERDRYHALWVENANASMDRALASETAGGGSE